VVLLTYYLNHRPGSHDSRRVEVEEKRVGLESEDAEDARVRSVADMLEKIAQTAQDQARADRERANTALSQAQIMETEMTKLRDEVETLRVTVRDQGQTIKQLREEIAQVLHQNRVYERANNALEKENERLRNRYTGGDEHNDASPAKPTRSGA
jgi:ElaB/YqjD/DUF883 family membrane-anchored ribosome-binding protein